MITEYSISAKLEHYTAWLTFLAMLAIYRRQRMGSRQCPVNQMWLYGRLYSVLADFIIMWRWENVLLNEFLNWSLKMLLVSNIYGAADNRHLCGNVEWQGKERGNRRVTPGLK
jgi:hypothetical protein